MSTYKSTILKADLKISAFSLLDYILLTAQPVVSFKGRYDVLSLFEKAAHEKVNIGHSHLILFISTKKYVINYTYHKSCFAISR